MYRQSDAQLMDTASTFIGAQSKKRALGGDPGDYYVDTYQVI